MPDSSPAVAPSERPAGATGSRCPLLEVDDLQVSFGAVRALQGVSFHVDGGEILGMIGPNGSGKTTLFNTITGFVRPSAGKVTWNGTNIIGWPSHRIAQSGLVRTFQQLMTFPGVTVRENIEIALQIAGHARNSKPTVEHLLDLLNLRQFETRAGASLSYGNQRRLGMALALARGARLLLLDEPTAGLPEAEEALFSGVIRSINSEGVSVVVIEHDMGFLLPLVNRIVVLDAGRKLAEGEPTEIQRHPAVIESYLGSRFASEGHHVRPTSATPDETGGRRPVLICKNVNVSYGPVRVLRGLNVSVHRGESVALLGPNGAGKSTLLKAISHLVRYRGSIEIDGTILSGSAEQVVRDGIGHVLQGRHIFTSLTVRENLQLCRMGRAAPGFDDDLAFVLDVLPMLKDKMKRLGGQMSGGQQQALAIARTLIMRPKVLLMDEPSLGIAPRVIDELGQALVHVRKEWNVTILMAEQSLAMALEVADSYLLLRRGKIRHSGRLDAPNAKEEVLKAYLGPTEQEEALVDEEDLEPAGKSPVRLRW